MTSLDEAMREVRLDQSVVDQAVKGIDFGLASEILALKVRALPTDRYDARLLDAEFLETCVRELVLSELKDGRERGAGVVGSHQKAFFRASYALKDGDRDVVIEKHRRYFESALANSPAVIAAIDHLVQLAREGDLTLLCWCAPKPCHADTIAEELRRRLGAGCATELVR